jgi:hypothetical protein
MRKSHCAKRAASGLLVIPILLCSVSFSSQAVLPIRIEKIMPDKMNPGDSVKILLNEDVSKYSKDLSVFFDSLRGEILNLDLKVINAKVPIDLPPGGRVQVVVQGPGFKTEPALIAVLPLKVEHAKVPAEAAPIADAKRKLQPIRIEKILPEKVYPGSSVEIYLNADISKYSKDIRVSFDSLQGETVLLGPKVMGAKVPMDLPPRDGVQVVVWAPEFKTEPALIPVLPIMRIEKILPEKVYPGSSVEIYLNANISKYLKENMIVFFDKFQGQIFVLGPKVMEAKVPMDLPPRDGVQVVVQGPEFKTEPALITVLRSSWFKRFFSHLFHNPIYISAIIALIGTAIAVFLWRRNIRKKKEEFGSALERSSAEVPPAAARIPEAERESQPREVRESAPFVPEVPPELVEACKKGECVLFAGADLNKPAGLPTSQEFVQGLLQWALDNKILDSDPSRSYLGALQSGQADLVADSIASAVQASVAQLHAEDVPAEKGTATDNLLMYLREVFVRPSAQPTRTHHLLKQIGFSGALTTNIDSLLEQALAAPVFTLQDAQKLLPNLAEREPFVLKLFGTLERPETVQISPARYRDAVADNKIFLEFIEKLFLSRTVLFVGTNLDGVQSNLEALRLRQGLRSHYAIVGVSGNAWRLQAESLQNRFGVQILPYPAGAGDEALVNYLGELATRVPGESSKAKAAPRRPPCLKRVRLENIGPFEALDIQLDPRWNIFLGDNGVGKSSVLKAIALALAGKSVQGYADRFIKFGKSVGRIVLELTDGATLVTELYRTSAEAEIKVLSQRELLGAEQWLAIGFPPLRQVGWALPITLESKPRTPYTTPKDLVPLVTGDFDPRMTDLKQSILHYDTLSKEEGGERYRKLLDDFFDVLDQVTPGVKLQRGHISQRTYEIFVETDDGEVPLAAVSQGTQSLMGWIGLLLERLYEVYDNMDNPREGSGLVLIDEIDAHMHPLWQQTIVHNLAKFFPEVQFIATTHSPMIVGGMNVKQVIRFTRDSRRRVVQLPVEEDMVLGRADQLLTSSLFGLETTMDKTTQEILKQIQDLMAKPNRTAEDDRILTKLRQTLEVRIPVSQETPIERRAQELLHALLEEQVGDSYPEVKNRVLKRAEQLFAELQARGEQGR